MENFEDWVKSIKQQLELTRRLRSIIGKPYLKGVNGERVVFETINKWMGKYKCGFKEKQAVYVRIGDLIFLDSRFKEKLHPNFIKPYKANLFWLYRFASPIIYSNYRQYSALTLHALNSLDLKGKTVLDLGTADGILGLVANRKDSKKVVAVEREKMWGKIFPLNIKLNEMDTSKFNFIFEDIRKTDYLLKKIPAEDIDVVVANIGPHRDYGNTHRKCISLLGHLPNVNLFVGGAYTLGNDNFIADLKLLKKMGFIKTKIVQDSTWRRRVAFIAERQLR